MKISVLFGLCFLASCQVATSVPKHEEHKQTIDERVEQLISQMTLEEKVEQLSGVGFDTVANQRLGIPAVKMADGPAGVRRGNATAFPAPIALAASWDRDLLFRVGRVIGKEAESKGITYVLGPCINIHRFPLGGRNFESYGEDPYLTAQLAVPFVKGIQSNRVLAAAKHFVVNNQEWQRNKIDVRIDERSLREIYFPAFKAVVQEAKTHTVMTAYNVVNGVYASENKWLLNDVLKQEWGFDGYVVSDWAAVVSTVPTAKAGMDLEMPFATFFGEKLLRAARQGEVQEEVIDDKVRRIMKARMKAGIFDADIVEDPAVIHSKSHHELAQTAAASGIVLLKNENQTLPLDRSKLKRIALIGPNAGEAVTGAGGSSMVVPTYAISPEQGVKELLPEDVQITVTPGVAIDNDILPISAEYFSTVVDGEKKTGLLGQYYASTDLTGEPVMTRVDTNVSFFWSYGAPHSTLHAADDNNHFSVRWTGKVTPPLTGEYEFLVMHPHGVRLRIDKKTLIEQPLRKGEQTIDNGRIHLVANRAYEISLEYFQYEWESGVKLGWRVPGRNLMEQAVEAARKADVAIVFAGLSSRHEGEGNDRDTLALGKQDELIRNIRAANPHTVVVLETGTPVSMEGWHEQVPAILQAWYPGQEGGRAIADVLLGEVNPSGKLPFSFIGEKSGSAAFNNYKSPSLEARYDEGIFVGYRYLEKNSILPLYAFGHGLSYTSFEYSEMRVLPLSKYEYAVDVTVINTGTRPGKEVVQLYISDSSSKVPRPIKELKAFEKISLEPKEKKSVRLLLDNRAFEYFEPTSKKWVVEPGSFQILVGGASDDIKLKEKIVIR